MAPPSICERTWFGYTAMPQSIAHTMRCTRTPPSGATETSATCAAYEPYENATAIPRARPAGSGVPQLVDERLGDEPVLRGADGPPEADRHAEVLLHPFDADVRDVVGMIARALDGGGIDGALRRAALLDEDAGPDDAVPPGDGLAARVERSLEDVVRRRAIEAMLDVVLARPDDLHGRVDGLRRLDGVGDEVGLAAPAEAAPEQRRHDLHALHRHAGEPRGERLVAARVLRRRPEGDAVGHDVRGGVHRLHARVLEERHLVDGLDDLAAGAQRLLGVALVARDLARLLGGRRILLADLRAGERGHGALVPRDLERAAALQRRPEVGGDDGDAVGDLHDVLDAGHGLGGRRVEGLHLAAEDGAALDRGDQHARHLHVHAVDRPAVGLDRNVETGDAL